MSEEQQNQNQSTQSTTGDSWKEVGSQFEALGNSLAEVFKTAWNNVESNVEAQQVKTSLESAVRQVGQALDDVSKTPEAQNLKDNAKRTAESLRTAGEQTVEEARPQILSALQKANEELQKLIDRLQSK